MGVREEVCELAAIVGSDPLLTQGAGGNISWKSGGVLWIKASGTRLRDAWVNDIFVPVDLKALQRNLDSGVYDAPPIVLMGSELRPSIETNLHALLPHDIVLHVHSVDALAALVRRDASEVLMSKLGAVQGWALVPYARPGADLAHALRVVRDEHPDSWGYFLANHGIVVAGATVEEVAQRLASLLEPLGDHELAGGRAVTASPGVSRREAVGQEVFKLCHESLDWLVNNVHRRELEVYWALYPDHVVFLGPKAPATDRLDAVTGESLAAGYGFVVVLGEGVFCRSSFSAAAEEMLICYADVLRRQDSLAHLKTITNNEVGELIGWESEKFRLELSK